MRFLPPGATALILPFTLLFILTRIVYDYWPYTWSDEALFSSPAAALATQGIFSTPVLAGLIPGMETATLWNSPLFMLLLSGIYSITGESQIVARSFSFVLALLALTVFYNIARLLFSSGRLALLLTLILVCDLTLIRGANTARMDLLTYLFVLLTIYFLLKAFLEKIAPAKGEESGVTTLALMAGVATGLAALSHPIAIILVPLHIIFLFPRFRALLISGTATAVTLSSWLIYIIPNYSIFQEQFLSQLHRKSELLQLWGGETGGILVVFSSQYGGTRVMMAAVLLLLLLIFGASLIFIIKKRLIAMSEVGVRLWLGAASTTILVMLATEAWYPIYVGFWLVLLGAWLSQADTDRNWRWPRLPLQATALFFIASTLWLIFRNQVVQDRPAQIAEQNRQILPAVKECSSLYLRAIPDPYFIIRKNHPEIDLYEFIPGKLRFSGEDTRLRIQEKYDEIHCFLLGSNHKHQPLVTEYLENRRSQFKSEKIAVAGLDTFFLWKRSAPRP